MSKAKLTIKTVELDAYKLALSMADIKVLQVVPHVNDINKVEVSYKLEQQLVDTGLYVASILNDSTKLNQTQKQNKNENVKANKNNKGSRNRQG